MADSIVQTTNVHILGTGSGAGKSTLCLGLLAWLVKQGIQPEELAYIKPMTQCVDSQPVVLFCEQQNIAYPKRSPVIFSKGFTRDFLAGKSSDKEQLLRQILGTMNTLSIGKRYLIVDGIGHPAVGSTIGLSNTVITNVLNKPIVLLVAPPGIGATIDSLTMCLTYLKSSGITKVGILLNKIPRLQASEMYYFVEKTIKNLFREVEFYGCLPEIELPRGIKKGFDIEVLADWIEENMSPERVLF